MNPHEPPNFEGDFDLGDGFSYSFHCWKPDRRLNPQYEGIPDVERMGATIFRDGEVVAAITFDLPEVRRIPGVRTDHLWRLVSVSPLHVEPSLQMYDRRTHEPSHHGFIRNGRWVWA